MVLLLQGDNMKGYMDIFTTTLLCIKFIKVSKTV